MNEKEKYKPVELHGTNPIPYVHETVTEKENLPAEQEEEISEQPAIPSETIPEEGYPQEDEVKDQTSASQPETSVSKEPKTDSIPTEEPKKYSKLEQDVYKERERRRKMQAENAELKARLDRLENSYSSKDEEEKLVKFAQEDLGIDEESAKRISKFIKRANRQDPPPVDPVKDKLEEFKKRAIKVASKHPDWPEYQEEMARQFQDDYEIDPEEALANGPAYYYELAKRSTPDPEKLREEGRKEMANKISQKNLAATESSRNSLGKPAKSNGWTPEKIREYSQNPDLYKKYRNEILEAATRLARE